MRYIIVIFLFFTCNSMFGQLWAPLDAHWYFSWQPEMWENKSGFVEITYEGDTTINFFNCKKLLKTQRGWDMDNSTNYTIQMGYDFTTEIDSIIYIYDEIDQDFDTLFCFNKPVGYYWSIPMHGYSSCENNGTIEIIEKGNSVLNGYLLPWMRVDINFDPINGGSQWDYTDTIYERFGSSGLYYLPYSWCEANLEMPSITDFRCYSDYDFSTYNTTSSSCDYTLSLNELHNGSMKIYPNPANELLFFDEVDLFNSEYIQIIDLLGKVIDKKKLYGNSIDVSSLKKGVYFLKIIGHKSIAVRFVKN